MNVNFEEWTFTNVHVWTSIFDQNRSGSIKIDQDRSVSFRIVQYHIFLKFIIVILKSCSAPSKRYDSIYNLKKVIKLGIKICNIVQMLIPPSFNCFSEFFLSIASAFMNKVIFKVIPDHFNGPSVLTNEINFKLDREHHLRFKMPYRRLCGCFSVIDSI